MKGYEFLRFMADVYQVPAKERMERINQLVVNFGMEKDLASEINSYSHGMRQKMMVMGALLINPKVWILDEPMVGLDPRSAFEMKQKMREHADKGNIVLFSTHVLEVAEKLVDRICVINKGQIVFVGTVAELRANMNEDASLEDLFLELTNNEDSVEVAQAE